MAQLLSRTLADAHDPVTGDYNALALAGALAVDIEGLARMVGYTGRGLRLNPTSRRLQPQLSRLAALALRLAALAGSLPAARTWLKAPHPALGYRSPLSYLLERKPEVVEDLLADVELGQPD